MKDFQSGDSRCTSRFASLGAPGFHELLSARSSLFEKKGEVIPSIALSYRRAWPYWFQSSAFLVVLPHLANKSWRGLLVVIVVTSFKFSRSPPYRPGAVLKSQIIE